MLWTIAVVLVILWLLGLGTGFTMGSFIHILFVAAVALLVVSITQEMMINRNLRHVLRSRSAKPDGKKGHEQFKPRSSTTGDPDTATSSACSS